MKYFAAIMLILGLLNVSGSGLAFAHGDNLTLKSTISKLKKLERVCRPWANQPEREVQCLHKGMDLLKRWLKQQAEQQEFFCADKNVFGEFAHGGGCGVYGCWYPGGGCNVFGCWYEDGKCDVFGCSHQAPKTKKACTD